MLLEKGIATSRHRQGGQERHKKSQKERHGWNARWLFLVCVSLSGTVWAANAPRIVCGRPVHNFGAMDNSLRVKHTFVIRNDGNKPLKIGR